AEDFAQPTQETAFRRSLRKPIAPVATEPFYLVPVLFPAKLRKTFSRARKEFRQRRHCRQKLNLCKAAGDYRGVLRTRAIFAQDVNVIDQHICICAAQNFFDLQERHFLENLLVGSAQKSKQKFQPRIFLQFQPCSPGVVIEGARSRMREPVVVRDLDRLERSRDQPREGPGLWKQNADAFAVFFEQKLRRQCDDGPRLLSQIATDEKINIVS